MKKKLLIGDYHKFFFIYKKDISNRVVDEQIFPRWLFFSYLPEYYYSYSPYCYKTIICCHYPFLRAEEFFLFKESLNLLSLQLKDTNKTACVKPKIT